MFGKLLSIRDQPIAKVAGEQAYIALESGSAPVVRKISRCVVLDVEADGAVAVVACPFQ